MCGCYIEFEFGNVKVGGKELFKVKLLFFYYKFIVNGEEWIEIDYVNFIECVFGVDCLVE